MLDSERRPSTIVDVTALHHHTIVAGGELVGVWEYDPEQSIVLTRVWRSGRTLRTGIGEAAAQTQQFIRKQFGDAPLSAVDPPARRAARIAFCRRIR